MAMMMSAGGIHFPIKAAMLTAHDTTRIAAKNAIAAKTSGARIQSSSVVGQPMETQIPHVPQGQGK